MRSLNRWGISAGKLRDHDKGQMEKSVTEPTYIESGAFKTSSFFAFLFYFKGSAASR